MAARALGLIVALATLVGCTDGPGGAAERGRAATVGSGWSDAIDLLGRANTFSYSTRAATAGCSTTGTQVCEDEATVVEQLGQVSLNPFAVEQSQSVHSITFAGTTEVDFRVLANGTVYARDNLGHKPLSCWYVADHQMVAMISGRSMKPAGLQILLSASATDTRRLPELPAELDLMAPLRQR